MVLLFFSDDDNGRVMVLRGFLFENSWKFFIIYYRR